MIAWLSLRRGGFRDAAPEAIAFGFPAGRGGGKRGGGGVARAPPLPPGGQAIARTLCSAAISRLLCPRAPLPFPAPPPPPDLRRQPAGPGVFKISPLLPLRGMPAFLSPQSTGQKSGAPRPCLPLRSSERLLSCQKSSQRGRGGSGKRLGPPGAPQARGATRRRSGPPPTRRGRHPRNF